jgi:hypothetical protein
MKALKTINKVLEMVDSDIAEHVNNINKEYKQNIKLERNILLKQISEEYKLNYNLLLEQYVHKKSSNITVLQINNIMGQECFYENKNNSNVYDDECNIIGTFKNNNIIMNETSV